MVGQLLLGWEREKSQAPQSLYEICIEYAKFTFSWSTLHQLLLFSNHTK